MEATDRDVTWRSMLKSGRRDDADLIRLWKTLLEGLDTPLALGLKIRLDAGMIEDVLRVKVNPLHYLGHEGDKYLRDVQAVSFLQKYPFKRPPVDTRAAALNTLYEGERSCGATNRFLKDMSANRVSPVYRRLPAVLERARTFIADTVGVLDVEEWLNGCRFGPGVCSFQDTPEPDVAAKLASDPSVTDRFEPYALEFLAEFPGWVDALTNGGNSSFGLRVVPGGKHTVVPKTALTDRNIEPQPTINIFAQLGLGHVLRQKLRGVGIDLQTGQDTNRALSRKGSITGALATIDLSNASDTISYELVRLLLPPDWFHAMDLIRTSCTLVDGVWIENQKFSAMGNGYTFELETLIFLALARAICGPKATIAVYGDDIIVPTVYFNEVCQVLKSCGFTPNPKKSFSTGYFRESCGADWFQGKIVRAYQQKDQVTDVPSLISLANGLARAAMRSNRGYGFDRRYRAAWVLCLRWIHPQIRRQLAWGLPSGDEYLFSWKFRGRRFVVVESETKYHSSWFTAKAVALYNAAARGRDVSIAARMTPYLSNIKVWCVGSLSGVAGSIIGDSRGGNINKVLTRPTERFSASWVPGDPWKVYRDWGAPPLLGCSSLVPAIGFC